MKFSEKICCLIQADLSDYLPFSESWSDEDMFAFSAISRSSSVISVLKNKFLKLTEDDDIADHELDAWALKGCDLRGKGNL